jgi:alkaline phosphatase
MALRRSLFVCLAVTCLLALSTGVHGQTGAKNIILMIADGGGFNQYTSASYYQNGAAGSQVYDGPGWVKYGCTTYDVYGSYSPSSMWSAFSFQQDGATDSAAAATALNTGVKTYDGAIDVDVSFEALATIAQIEDARGRSTGAVTTVPLSHATPACVWAHNDDRGNYEAIANEMIYNSGLDVIMGAGNPDYNNDGQPASMTSEYVGGATTWSQLKNGTTGQGWTLIESKTAFESYAANPNLPAARLIGIAQASYTLQEKRSSASPNTNVPDLQTISMAAINVLSKNPNGFFLMIEGGAIDFANHDMRLDRMLEEFGDFSRAVEAVANWVETHSSWDQTLLIITADHESGCLWGPDSGDDVFGTVINNGAHVLPGAIYYTGAHTNQLVPLYARGVGSELFASKVKGTDGTAAVTYGFSGQYVDNTDVFQVMNAAATAPFVCDPVMATDLDGNCKVDFGDYALMADSWGQSPPERDIVTDGTMNFLDLAELASDWLRCSRVPPGSCD